MTIRTQTSSRPLERVLVLAAAIAAAAMLVGVGTKDAAAAEFPPTAPSLGVVKNVSSVTAWIETGCKEITVRNTRPFVDTDTLYAYFQRVKWCWAGGAITSVASSHWAEVYDSAVTLIGPVPSPAPLIGMASAISRTQTHIRVAQTHFYPWIEITLRAGGTYSAAIG